MLVLVLIVAIAACLGIGLFLGEMPLVWCALGASVLGVLLLGYLIYADRRSSASAVDEAPEDPTAPDAPGEPSAEASPAPSPEVAEAEVAESPVEPAPVVESPVEPAPVDAAPVEAPAERPELADPDRIVHVVPGRRRFHVDGCRLLVDKPAEEINLDEAREEGFTACTSCIPDREALPSPR